MRSLAFDMVKYRLQIVRSTSTARHSDIRQKRREAVREAEEERRGGRGGRLRGSVAAGDAVRGGGEGGAAGGGDAVPDAEPSGETEDADRQRAARAYGERGVVAPQGIAYTARLTAALEDPESRLPDAVRKLGGLLLDRIGILTGRIKELKAEILKRAPESDEAKRLMGIPGAAPVCATAFGAGSTE